MKKKDLFVVDSKNFNSRLIVGTGKYKNMQECAKAIKISGAEIVTVAVRRVNILDSVFLFKLPVLCSCPAIPITPSLSVSVCSIILLGNLLCKKSLASSKEGPVPKRAILSKFFVLLSSRKLFFEIFMYLFLSSRVEKS